MSSTAFPERRQVDRNDVQPVVQVFAKTVLVDFVLQVAIGGGHDAAIDPNGSRIADPLKFVLLQDPQQFDLQLVAHGIDFIEEDRAAVGGFKSAGAVLEALVKAPLTWPNSSLSSSLSLSAPQLTRMQGPVARAAQLVDGPRMSSLPVPVSPVSNTVADVGETCRVRRYTSRIGPLSPIIPSITAAIVKKSCRQSCSVPQSAAGTRLVVTCGNSWLNCDYYRRIGPGFQ